MISLLIMTCIYLIARERGDFSHISVMRMLIVWLTIIWDLLFNIESKRRFLLEKVLLAKILSMVFLPRGKLQGTIFRLWARDLVNMMDGIEHSNRAPTIFVELSKTLRPRIVLMKHDALPIRYFCFCSIAVFNSSNWEQYFSEFIVSLFGKS